MTQTYQTWFKTVLAEALTATATTLLLKTPPTVTKGRMRIINGSIEEWISFSGVTWSTITGMVRWLSQTADPATAGTGLSWWAGTQIILVAMHDQLPDKQETTAFTWAITATDLSFTGTTTPGLRTKNLTSTQRLALTPSNGDIVYDTTDGVHYQYIGGAWATFATGSVANASTTAAGKIEIATSAETIAGTDTGGTGAFLSVLPSDQAKNIQSSTFVYATSPTGSDTYVITYVPALPSLTQWMRIRARFTTPNVWACSLNPNGIGDTNIKLIDWTDPLNWDITTGVDYDFIYNGTNLVLQQVPLRSTTSDVTTGTNTLKYTTPAQMASRTATSQGVFTRAANASSNTQTITHGLPATPRKVRMSAKWVLATNGNVSCDSDGTYNWTNTNAIYRENGNGWTSASSTDTTNIVHITNTPWAISQVCTITYDATNITLVWTSSSSAGGTIAVLWECQT